MALVIGKLTQDISNAFTTDMWDDCASQIADAIDSYFKSGLAQVTISGTVTPPSPASSYPAAGIGTGNPQTTTVSALKQAWKSAFKSTAWSAIGGIVAPEIDNLVKSAQLQLKVSNILVGTGTGTFQTIGPGALQQQLNNSFTANAWDITASQIATAVDAFIKAVVVQGTASGVVPVNSWVGAGTGTVS